MEAETRETELPKTYEPQAVEGEIYKRWEASGFFNPDKLPGDREEPFSIIMPPPNANGALHIGHAVFVTLQDILIRFWRMRGKKSLWIPGADHAGFETQVVFDKKLEKEGRNRFDMSRGELLSEMLEFTEKNKGVMENQLRKLGASCDWSRKKFTLDPDVVGQVQDSFVKLYEAGLIYRGERIVNWCVKHQTTLSDLEVKHEERSDPLYHIAYGPLTLATVRPETKFGDTAVAVHPEDPRYKEYIGTEIEIETLLGPATIRVVADEAVDREFGTGVVKVTPAHDPADFEMGRRHNLEVRPVIGRDGRLNEKTGPYAGLKVAEAREKVVADMEVKGLLKKIDREYRHSVAVCYKCGNVVEPLVMPQWFLSWTKALPGKNQSIRDLAVKAVEEKKVAFIPERSEKEFLHWMEILRDWNISRQIPWGIRIPAWYCVNCSNIRVGAKPKGNWYFVRHGETDWNVERRVQGHADTPLNENGRAQAARAGEELIKRKTDLIISSDLARSKETAEIISRATGAEVLIDPEFRERNFGEFEGVPYTEVNQKHLPHMTDADYTPNGGESLRNLEERVHAALLRHKDAHAHKNVVIVSHGGALRSLLAKLKGLSSADLREIKFKNASILHLAVMDPCENCGSDFFEQDPDVLDTWFSSGQWPYITLGYPDSKDFKTFYPTSVMETGYDILFFWVARMIMFGLWQTGGVPFNTVYLHGLVRDKDRQKMSKSKGNVIDPLGVAETYGTDAVRMALVIGNLPGNDTTVSEEKIRGYRNFANKLWNIHRFIAMRTEGIEGKPSKKDAPRRDELKTLIQEVTARLEAFEFHHAAEKLYHYAWHEFADTIIEESKPRLASDSEEEQQAAASLLIEIEATVLTLLHPFMPYITETLWVDLARRGLVESEMLMVAEWPKGE